MGDAKNFITEEKNHINNTIILLKKILDRPEIDDVDRVALSTLVMNIYSGIENILRYILEKHGVRIRKSGSWHKDLLSSSHIRGLITDELFETLKDYLTFRHFQVHGYGYMLAYEKMEHLVVNAEETANRFFSEIEEIN